jgi:hypothetical protein
LGKIGIVLWFVLGIGLRETYLSILPVIFQVQTIKEFQFC